jgi:hypothetical protein
MPDLIELVNVHGTIKRYYVELVVEHGDGYMHKIATPQIRSNTGFNADDMHRELIKTAEIMSVADIETDQREKQARKK